MAYSPNAFQATHLWQRVYDKLEQTKGLSATGGSTTTIVDSSLSVDYQDDDLNGYAAFISYDAGGSGAAPEGEVQLVSSYVSSTTTLTTAAFSIAVGAGDQVTLARTSLFPLNDVKRVCNNALRNLGDVAIINTSLTTAANQTEYSIPSTVRYGNIIDVLIPTLDDSDNNKYRSYAFKIIPPSSIAGTATLVLPQQPETGKTILIASVQPHTNLVNYYDPISLDIHPTLAVVACALECGRWNRNAIDSETNRTSLLTYLEREFTLELARHPITRYNPQIHGMPNWTPEYGRRYPGDQTFYDR